jgi:hypothetical protein
MVSCQYSAYNTLKQKDKGGISLSSERHTNSKTGKTQVDDKTLAYIAGLFDAEVSFHIDKNNDNYYLRLDWLKIDRDILQYVSDIFGGTVTSVKLQPRQRYQVWHWYLGESDTYAALKRIYPFLRIKQKPASICLEFYIRYSEATTVSDRRAIGAEYYAKLQEYQRKPGGSKKSAEALKIIREHMKSTTIESESQGIMHQVLPDMMLPKTETVYIAGLLDAESSFLINKLHLRPSYLLEVKYRKYDRPTLEYLATIFGGRVRRAPISSKNQIQPWLWQVTSQKAYRLIQCVYILTCVSRKRMLRFAWNFLNDIGRVILESRFLLEGKELVRNTE